MRRFSTLVKMTDPAALAKHLEGKVLVDGAFRSVASRFDVKSPATGKLIAGAARGTEKEVNEAVVAANTAFESSWAETPARERGRLIAKCGDLLRDHAEEIAKLTALETGKALRTESLVEAGVVSDSFTFFGGLGGELKGMTIPWSPNSMTYTVHEPLGVCGVIIPWNAPLMLMSLKIAPAIVAGNTVVVKSAEEAPLGVLRVAEIMNSVLPKGVMNLVSGFGEECGAPLVRHPLVKKVSFTGSVETGRLIYQEAAKKLIPATLELGGKSPMIVMPDCDLEKAVVGALSAMRFTRAGQSCTAASRMFVHDSIYDEFVRKMAAAVDKMVIGDPLDQKTDIGTIISKSQYDKVKSYIAMGEKLPGVKAIHCSKLPSDPTLKDGFFIRPVIFTEIDNVCRLSREEIFGPVTCVIRFSSFDEAIKMANDTDFGLAASIWTRDLKNALQATKRLKAGVVQVNQNFVLNPNFPVGGWKLSGLGREASLEAMIETFTKPKLVSMNLQ